MTKVNPPRTFITPRASTVRALRRTLAMRRTSNSACVARHHCVHCKDVTPETIVVLLTLQA